MGVLSDIQAISADSEKLATDQATLQGLQAQVTAATARVADDQGASGQADATLSADLQAQGPVFTANPDGTVNVYAFAAAAPGYTITAVKPAS